MNDVKVTPRVGRCLNPGADVLNTWEENHNLQTFCKISPLLHNFLSITVTVFSIFSNKDLDIGRTGPKYNSKLCLYATLIYPKCMQDWFIEPQVIDWKPSVFYFKKKNSNLKLASCKLAIFEVLPTWRLITQTRAIYWKSSDWHLPKPITHPPAWRLHGCQQNIFHQQYIRWTACTHLIFLQ